jgi:protein phosphatase
MEFNIHTTKGKREENQDTYWCVKLNVEGYELCVVCVCDGMGGLNEGRLASSLVAKAVRDYYTGGNYDFEGLQSVLEDVNREIYIKGLSVGAIGTTCTLLSTYKGQYKIFHTGDSRCYKVSNQNVEILTEDHSALAKCRREGKVLTPEKEKKYRNTLTRALGVSGEFKIDYIDGEYNQDDLFLVCSDGFWHYLQDDDFKSGEINNLKNLTGRFIELGETDNITSIVLTV